MVKLSVNVNKIATLRNTRPKLNIPDLVELCRIVLDAGADGLTIHPRPDQRHIRSRDVLLLADLLQDWPAVEFNIEGNPFEGQYMQHCCDTRPDQCTLVPDSTEQGTSDHGWSFPEDFARLKLVVDELKQIGCRVSLFMDPIADQIPFVRATGADRVELYTEPYAALYPSDRQAALRPYLAASEAARRAGLEINAGHDLSLENLAFFLEAIPDTSEVSIGHALISDALKYGLASTVAQYRSICQQYGV